MESESGRYIGCRDCAAGAIEPVDVLTEIVGGEETGRILDSFASSALMRRVVHAMPRGVVDMSLDSFCFCLAMKARCNFPSTRDT